ncbi:MAG TPA: hypothetical protein RMH85_22680 [Polyangiaceae bacterium LLY-WYZ-15_(1-7)]|nr:hypothetical protein [Myxococcales bacterium]MAT23511.1 hypothetical protein [Sandaracinus sp.]HJK90978.1 hypothetical protein [Polyangiaceae bacterium LLY-WYZ-15_(1-7)]HJL02628.1 hypothetical protein [Polyangiaceae bacterium LLY-WYZ-15_(1-7)]HJL11298.1 hypothetical protein [Polyangiaceae bacterium LLY-WYZ-15_(1-7)]
METWMMIAGAGGLLGLIALGGMIWAFRKLESPKKWAALGGFVVLGAAGAYLSLNATAFETTEEEAEIEEQIEDFDAPLDDF